jgi:hypothetical protein
MTCAVNGGTNYQPVNYNTKVGIMYPHCKDRVDLTPSKQATSSFYSPRVPDDVPVCLAVASTIR